MTLKTFIRRHAAFLAGEDSPKKKAFLDDVAQEIRNLAACATMEELTRLNIATFKPSNAFNCVYGQMTQHCASKRAKELMDKCCIRCMDLKKDGGSFDILNRSIDDPEFRINGPYTGQTWEEPGHRNYSHISALEAYILSEDANNEGVLNYLRHGGKFPVL